MTTTTLAFFPHYREEAVELDERAGKSLGLAADALHMAQLTLDGSADEDHEAKQSRAASARRLLVEAVQGLARARVFVPGVRTYAVTVVTNSERDIDRELARLHQLATQLLWRNHRFLPARAQAEPLTPEDEAQLAAVLRTLGTHARIDRAMRYKWLVGAALFGVLAPVLGVGLYLLAAASGAMAAVELSRGAPPPALPQG
ncbi:hypothetical protein PPSIR1_10880 [Plesiocystis pacifica SIR-1]|uniref:Uncharacterized protein n=1 Tax=Plesiocystis pacifica SIR-1 TaxID=391625 RepID=A6G510_9BACT|nr:hypothetical protein [Plesiocystis pacifica]EDM79102.1 hypothetical protein PPSIR1_10880 [Plesiocystis pacifica SIR-1]